MLPKCSTTLRVVILDAERRATLSHDEAIG